MTCLIETVVAVVYWPRSRLF